MEPISVVSAQRGLVLLLKERAMMLERVQAGRRDSDEQIFLRSEKCKWEAPSVIVLRQYVNILDGGKRGGGTLQTHCTNSKRKAGGNRQNSFPAISTTNVLRRDGGVCAYCGGKAASIDHVIPVSRGGKHSWDNVVAACCKCNHKKSNKLLSECGKDFKAVTLKKLGPPNLMVQRLGSLWMKGGASNPHWAQFFGACPDIFIFSKIHEEIDQRSQASSSQ